MRAAESAGDPSRPRPAGQLTRRDFLYAANAAAALLLLESCVPGLGSPAPKPSLPAGSSAEERALLLIQEAIRASPDHLARRGQDLVAGRDSTRIVEFVRDRFAVVPGWGEGLDPRTARRWGSAATIRGGQGTLRERADVLADLLTRAGFKASVMAADRPPEISVESLYQARPAAFAPDRARLQEALAELKAAGYPAPAPQRPFDPGPDPVAAILGALPAALQRARVRSDLLPQQVPVVQFSEGGRTRYAFALGALGVLDSAPPGLGRASDADSPPAITITISGIANPPPGSQTPRGRMIELVTGRWPLDQVAGRQVILTFAPPGGPKELLTAAPGDLPIRVPILRVQTDDPPTTAPASLTVAGGRLSLAGDVLGPPPSATAATPAAGGTMDGPYGPIRVLADADRKRAIAGVAKIEVAANPAAFPEIDLQLTVTDAGGAAVDGLDATSFSVQEQGTSVGGYSVVSNVRTQTRPRVLVAGDAGLNATWSSPAALSAFAAGLGGALAALAAKTPFDVQVVAFGGAPDPGAWAPPDAGAIAAALTTRSESADDPWLTLGGPAQDQGVAAIVLVSDNDPADSDPVNAPSYQRRLQASGVPVFTVPIGTVNEQQTALILTLSGGTRFDAADAGIPAAIAAKLAPRLQAYQAGGYRLRYTAPAGAPAQRRVTVTPAGRSGPIGAASYAVPDKPLPPPSFAGLYATISVGGSEVTRRLAGVELNDRGGPLQALDDATAVAETRAAMDGITTFAVEPGTPTSAALLDDVLRSLLSVEPLAPLLAKGSPDQLLAAGAHGIHRTPLSLPALLRPTAADPAGLPGLRVAIFQERALSAAGIENHVDLAFGLNPVIPVTADPAAAFRAALATSVHACAAEAATYSDTAYQRLEGQKLVPVALDDFAARDAFLAGAPSAREPAWRAALAVYADYHALVPAGGTAEAFWVVDPTTGAAKAVLLDSTGGGVQLAACQSDAFDQLALSVAELCIFCSLSPAGYSFYCAGINTLGVGLSVIQLFDAKRRDFGTPYAIVTPFLGLPAGVEASIGVMLILITLQKSCG